MLSWCSYCQRFMGEVPPYDDLIITHGICGTCESNVLSLTESDIAHAWMLSSIHGQLFEAGRRGDLSAAEKIIEASRRAGMKELDIVVGIIAPMLCKIGEDWKRGAVTVKEERRFTAFCERIIDILAVKGSLTVPVDVQHEGQGEILLINAPGNRHTLARRILALWLSDKGIPARTIDDRLNADDLIVMIWKLRPRFLMISMALAEQVPGVVGIVERIAALPELVQPKIMVGGYAVKLGLVSAIPGADLFADMSTCSFSDDS